MLYTGKVTYVPPQLKNVTIRHPGRERVVTINVSIPDLRQAVPTWSSSDSVPAAVKKLTLGQILTNPLTAGGSTYSTSIYFTGCQQGNPQTTVVATDRAGMRASPSLFVPTASTCVTGAGYSGYLYDSTTNVNALNTGFGVIASLSVTNSNPFPELTYDAYNVTLQITINVSASVSCSGAGLETEICKSLCDGGNPECLQPFASYCFPSNINDTCRNYFADYIETNGPSSVIDNGLGNYCQKKYTGIKDLFDNGGTEDIDLCSCNLSQQTYSNFENELFMNQPFLKQYAQQSKCLIEQCRNSKFISEPIPKGGCTVPNCVVINDFNNNGTFNNSTINTTVDGCGGTPSDTIPLWLQVLFLVIIVVVIALVVYYYVYMREPSPIPRMRGVNY